MTETSPFSTAPQQIDWLSALSRLVQGRVNPPTSQQPDMLTAEPERPQWMWDNWRAERRGQPPPEDVSAIPFGDLADPVSQLAFLLGPGFQKMLGQAGSTLNSGLLYGAPSRNSPFLSSEAGALGKDAARERYGPEVMDAMRGYLRTRSIGQKAEQASPEFRQAFPEGLGAEADATNSALRGQIRGAEGKDIVINPATNLRAFNEKISIPGGEKSAFEPVMAAIQQGDGDVTGMVMFPSVTVKQKIPVYYQDGAVSFEQYYILPDVGTDSYAVLRQVAPLSDEPMSFYSMYPTSRHADMAEALKAAEYYTQRDILNAKAISTSGRESQLVQPRQTNVKMSGDLGDMSATPEHNESLRSVFPWLSGNRTPGNYTENVGPGFRINSIEQIEQLQEAALARMHAQQATQTGAPVAGSPEYLRQLKTTLEARTLRTKQEEAMLKRLNNAGY